MTDGEYHLVLRVLLDCGCKVERILSPEESLYLDPGALCTCPTHAWSSVSDAEVIGRALARADRSSGYGCLEKRLLLACGCRRHEYTKAVPGEFLTCAVHREQKVVSAKPVGDRHAWASEQPPTGWLVCRGCGARHAGTHYGHRLHFEGTLDCGCPRAGDLPAKFLFQYGVGCAEHKTRKWRELSTTIVADDCACGRCVDRRRGASEDGSA